jgi:hypothetical protein
MTLTLTIVVLISSYLLLAFIIYTFTRITIQDPNLRRFFLLVGLSTPFLAVWALIQAPWSRRRTPPYNVALAEIEKEIEEERVRVFGGSPLRQTFSEAWRSAYLRSLAGAAKTVDRVAGSNLRYMVPTRPCL